MRLLRVSVDAHYYYKDSEGQQQNMRVQQGTVKDSDPSGSDPFKPGLNLNLS